MTSTVSIDNIREKYLEWQESILRGTVGHWSYFRVWPDGDVTTGAEASETLPESEYYSKVPHPITLDEENSIFSPSPDDGIFEWENDPEGDYEMEDGGCWAVANDNSSPDKRFKLGAMLDSSIEAINERFEQQLLPELKQWAEANGIMLED